MKYLLKSITQHWKITLEGIIMKNVLKENTEKEPTNILLQDEQEYEKK